MEIKKEANLLISKENIEEEELNIYPEDEDSKKCDEEINKRFPVDNWHDIFYYGKSPLIKNRFLEFISKSEFAKFFEALNYEYGINGFPKNLKKAFSMYRDNANISLDKLSMYKLYHIYRNEFTKFGLEKRNKVLEKYYLFMCFACLTRQEYQCYTLFFNRFNIASEVKVNIIFEDPDFSKFDKLMEHMKKYYRHYQINPDNITLIRAFMAFLLREQKNQALILLEPLIVKGYLLAIYQLTLMLNDKKKVAELFELLEQYKYYNCYCDYAIFLYKDMNDSQKALKLLKIAISKGIIRANYLYYDIFLSTVDFSKVKDNINFQKELEFIFNLLINEICLDHVFCFFEFFYLRKLCIKSFNFKDFVDKNYFEYMKAFVDILIQNSCSSPSEKDIKSKKDLIQKIYLRNDFFQEFNLACGIIYYYGIENLIKPDLKKSLFKFKISFDDSDNLSYQRFCYSYICRIKNKLYKQKDKEITKEDVENSKNKLFELYSSSININTIPYLSSSFFYYLYTLYYKKWGNNGDSIMEYICIKRASEGKMKNPGTGTIISYYRKYKSQKLIKSDEKLIIKLKEETNKNKDSEGYGEDGNICPICLENKRDIIFYPCKHRFCKKCTSIIMENSKCPICRGVVLINLDIKKIEN